MHGMKNISRRSSVGQIRFVRSRGLVKWETPYFPVTHTMCEKGQPIPLTSVDRERCCTVVYHTLVFHTCVLLSTHSHRAL